ncbi:FAD-binding protein [Natrarchaeobius sp. A-rgal3]|uniref:FAD-binding protein n=1 Tax=Natrarchaeobius versutus TaxID=1679078 RepID=UPI00350EAB9F
MNDHEHDTNETERRGNESKTDATVANLDPERYDVAVVGGGAAGLSAGIFTARAGLETIVLARGRSAIDQCGLLENYLGFPGGIDPATFLELGREHARYEGCCVESELVEDVDPLEDGFRVETAEGRVVDATRVVAASVYDSEYLPELDAGTIFDEDERFVETDRGGRTPIDGLYAAGRLTDVAHQAIVAAGNGARVGLAVVRDVHRDRGYWDEIADYRDWVVPDGRYGGEEWEAHVDEWVDGTIPEDASFDPERVERVRADVKERRLERQISEEERRRRIADGRDLLAEHVGTPDDPSDD